MAAPTPEHHPPRKRSFWSKVFIAGLLLLALNGWLRLWHSLDNWSLYGEIGLTPGPLYLALSGGVLGLAGLAAGLGLWARTGWGVPLSAAVIGVWLAWTWIDRLWLASSPLALVNWPFQLIASLAILLYSTLVLRAEKGQQDESGR